MDIWKPETGATGLVSAVSMLPSLAEGMSEDLGFHQMFAFSVATLNIILIKTCSP